MDVAKIKLREAIKNDIYDIVRIISDNPIGAKREDFRDPIPDCYFEAFERIQADHNQLLIVATYEDIVIGTLQISFISNMSVKGAYRALIEGMHVDSKIRGGGVGSIMMNWAIEQARLKGCNIVQLTSNKVRKQAHNFYQKLGFTATHEGFKMPLY